jgi:hypothetical protein
VGTSNTSVGFKHIPITPSNTTPIGFTVRSIYVGVGGDIVVVNRDGTTVTFVNYPQGCWLDGEFIRVNATGTSAGSLVGAL